MAKLVRARGFYYDENKGFLLVKVKDDVYPLKRVWGAIGGNIGTAGEENINSLGNLIYRATGFKNTIFEPTPFFNGSYENRNGVKIDFYSYGFGFPYGFDFSNGNKEGQTPNGKHFRFFNIGELYNSLNQFNFETVESINSSNFKQRIELLKRIPKLK